MTQIQQIITIVIIAVVTMLTRALPFMIFRSGRKTPAYIQYLGEVLPLAVFGMLVVYCLKDVQWLSGTHGIPEVIGILSTALIHLWKRKMLWSIAGGTVVYMLIIHLAI